MADNEENLEASEHRTHAAFPPSIIGEVKRNFRARNSVILTPPIATSNLEVDRSDVRLGQDVGTNSTGLGRPRELESDCAMSMSAPMNVVLMAWVAGRAVRLVTLYVKGL